MNENNQQNIKIAKMSKDIEYIKQSQKELSKGQNKLWSRFDSFTCEMKEMVDVIKKSAINYADNSAISHIREYDTELKEVLKSKYAKKEDVDLLLNAKKTANEANLKMLKNIKRGFWALCILVVLLIVVRAEYVNTIMKFIL